MVSISMASLYLMAFEIKPLPRRKMLTQPTLNICALSFLVDFYFLLYLLSEIYIALCVSSLNMVASSGNWSYVHTTFPNHFLFIASSSILGNNSGILNGFAIESSMPASMACRTCSLRAFALTANIGICPTISPECSNSRIRLAQVRPSITGISTSMRTIVKSKPVCICVCQNLVDFKKPRASSP